MSSKKKKAAAKAAKPKSAQLSPTEQVAHIRKMAQAVKHGEVLFEQANARVDRLTGERKSAMTDRKAIEKDLKERYEALALVAAGGFAELLPFGESKKPVDAVAAPKAEQSDAQALPKTAASNDEWKAVKIDTLSSLKPADITKLSEASVHTLGEMEEWRKTDCERPKILGFGKGSQARERIDDAVAEFWSDQRASAQAGADVKNHAKEEKQRPSNAETLGNLIEDAKVNGGAAATV